MARTKANRPSQGISHVLSQRRQQRDQNDSEEDERDILIESDDEPRRSRQSTSNSDGPFKRPLPLQASSAAKPERRIMAGDLDLSVKRYKQEKLPMIREIPQVAKAKLEEASIHYVTEPNTELSRYMKLSYQAARTAKHIEQSTIFKTPATDVMEKLKEGKQVVGTYVLEFFEGELYDKLLEHLNIEKKCRIFGPDVLIQAKNIEQIPKTNPLLGLSMMHITVCSTSFSKSENEQFAKKVGMMGGKFSKNLTEKTFVLIAKDVICSKSQIARKLGIPIVHKEWIDRCWSLAHRQSPFIAAEKIKAHKLPIFTGMRFSASQVSPEIRTRLERSATKYGFKYNPNLSDDVTHLVCERAEGDKFHYSRDRNIYTVKYKWIVMSVEAGYALPELDFMVGGPLEKDDDDPLGLKVKTRTTVEPVFEPSQLPETSQFTRKTFEENLRDVSQTLGSTSVSSQNESSNNFQSRLKHCLEIEAKQLLDNYEIHLYGFKNRLLEHYRQLIFRESGFCGMRISEETTIVIVPEDLSDREFTALKNLLTEKDLFCPVVNQLWLIDSLENSQLQPQSEYLVFSLENGAEEEVCEIPKEDGSQPGLGFVVTKRDRSLTANSSKNTTLGDMETDVIDHSSFRNQRKSVSLLDSVRESVKSFGATNNSWTTDDEEEDMSQNSNSQDDEESEEVVSDEEMEEESPSKSLSYATQRGPSRAAGSKVTLAVQSSQMPVIDVPEGKERDFVEPQLNSLAGNYYRNEEGLRCQEGFREATRRAKEMRLNKRKY